MSSVEVQARRCLRAWPAIDRIVRGDEIVATTLDLVPQERTRLPFSLAISLVAGGLMARHRARPPLWRWVLYQMSGVVSVIPIKWHPWLAGDILRHGFDRRQTARSIGPIWFLITFLPQWWTGFSEYSDYVVLFIGLGLLWSLVLWAATRFGGSSTFRTTPVDVVSQAGVQLAKEGFHGAALEVCRVLLDPSRKKRTRRRDLYIERHPRSRYAQELGQALWSAGFMEAAINLLTEAYEHGRRHQPDRRDTWSTGRMLARALADADRLDEAIEIGTKVLLAMRRIWGQDDVATLTWAANVAFFLSGHGRVDEAIGLLEDAFERGRRSAPNRSWPTSTIGRQLADALRIVRREDEACAVEAELLALEVAASPPPPG